MSEFTSTPRQKMCSYVCWWRIVLLEGRFYWDGKSSMWPFWRICAREIIQIMSAMKPDLVELTTAFVVPWQIIAEVFNPKGQRVPKLIWRNPSKLLSLGSIGSCLYARWRSSLYNRQTWPCCEINSPEDEGFTVRLKMKCPECHF